MSETNHTPTPWLADILATGNGDETCWVIDSDEGSIAEMTCPDDVEEVNARFIVRAVNAHDALYRALRQLNYMGSAAEGYCICPANNPAALNHSTACNDARAAIALAEGDSK